MGSMPLLDGARLRTLDEPDAEELHALIEVNRDHLARWLSWAATQTFDDTLAFIRRAGQQLAGNDGFQASIVREGKILGAIGYHGVDWRRGSTSIGYWLGEAHQGHGTMTQAARALTDHALSVWELNRVEVRAAAENRRSRRIPERLGFREEGTLRGAERIGDRYLDCVVYAMLKSTWCAQAP